MDIARNGLEFLTVWNPCATSLCRSSHVPGKRLHRTGGTSRPVPACWPGDLPAGPAQRPGPECTRASWQPVQGPASVHCFVILPWSAPLTLGIFFVGDVFFLFENSKNRSFAMGCSILKKSVRLSALFQKNGVDLSSRTGRGAFRGSSPPLWDPLGSRQCFPGLLALKEKNASWREERNPSQEAVQTWRKVGDILGFAPGSRRRIVQGNLTLRPRPGPGSGNPLQGKG